MRKKTARCIAVILVISYLVLIAGGIAFWMMKRSEGETQETLSEANASDNVSYGEDEQENIDVAEDITTEKDEEEITEPALGTDSKPEENPEEEKLSTGSVKMVFTGDVYIGNYVRSMYDAKGIHGVLSQEVLEQLEEADLTMINQEFPFSTRGEAMKDKQYTFRVDPDKVSLLQDMGVDVVTLANNHALDFGIDALVDTLDTLNNAGIIYSGAGNNLQEAKTTRYVDCNGKNIAILSASRVIPVSEWAAAAAKPGLFTTYDPTALLEETRAAREKADLVVVYLHWGLEKKEYPERYQRELGHQLIDAGADVVIGSHPHVLQGFEYYKDRLIVYSLGNFIFSQNIASTALFAMNVDEQNQITYQIIPCKTVDGKTQELTDENQIQEVYQYLGRISEQVEVDQDGYIRKK